MPANVSISRHANFANEDPFELPEPSLSRGGGCARSAVGCMQGWAGALGSDSHGRIADGTD